jgi:membrane protease YdiL (CAAX protease family)
LLQAGWPSPLLLSGVVWGIWHLPLFVLPGYAHGKLVLSLLMFTLLTALFGVFIGWLRLASGSVFVAAMAHTSFNSFVQSFFGVSFVGDGAWFLIGDYGLLTLISYGALVVWLYWSKRLPGALERGLITRSAMHLVQIPRDGNVRLPGITLPGDCGVCDCFDRAAVRATRLC